MEHFDQFEDFWREELESFESEPDLKEWEAIRDRLHPKRRVIPIWWLVPLAAALVGVGVFRYLPSQKNDGSNTAAVEQKTTIQQDKNSSILSNDSDNATITKPGTGNDDFSKSEKQTLSADAKRQRNITAKNNKLNSVNTEEIIAENTVKKEETVRENDNKQPKIDAPNNQVTPTINSQNATREAVAFSQLPTRLSQLPLEGQVLPTIEKVNSAIVIKEPVEKKQSKLKGFYVSAGTSMNFRNISPVKTDDFTMTAVQLPSTTSYNRLGWQAAIGYKLPINKHFSWRGSLQYQGFVAKLDYRLKLPEIENVETSGEVTSSGLSLKYEKIDLKQTDKNEAYKYHNFSLNNELGWSINTKNALYFGCSVGKMLGNKGLTTALNSTYSYKLKYFNIEPYFQYHLKYYASKEPIYNFQPYAFGVNFVF